MTNATVVDIDNFEIPEEMPESTLTTVARVKTSEFAKPGGKRAEGKVTRGEDIQVEYHEVLEPLSIKYDSDPAMFDHNNDEAWLSVFNRNGQLNGKGSLIDIKKQGYLKMGFPITNQTTAKAIEGHVFRYDRQKVTFMFDKVDPITGEKKKEESKPQYVSVPVERMADDWKPEGPVQTIQRPRDWRTGGAAPSAPAQADNSSVAIPALIVALNGKAESEYTSAILDTKNPELMRSPYITEATTDKAALTARMVAAGMVVVDGKLVVK